MDETNTPGISPGLSSDIFSTPQGAAMDMAQLIWGDWIKLIFDDSASGSITMLTPIAGYMNFLAYILISVIMSYVLIAAVIKTASEGKIMGNGWSSVWLPLRTFLACFFIFPVGIGQASTISTVQVIVAWMGMVGSNAADRVASFAVENMARRVNTVNPQVGGFYAIKQLTNNATCAFSLEISDPTGNGKTLDLYGINPSNPRQDLPINSALAGYERVEIGRSGACGSISVNTDNEELRRELMAKILEYQNRAFHEIAVPLLASSEDNPASSYYWRGGYSTYASALEGYDSQTGSDSSNETLGRFYSVVDKQLEMTESYKSDMAEIIAKHTKSENDLITIKSDSGGNLLAKINTSVYNDVGWPYLGAYYTVISMALNDINDNSQLASNSIISRDIAGCMILHQRRGSEISSFRSYGERELDCPYNNYAEVSDLLTGSTDKIIASRNTGEIDNTRDAIDSLCTGAKNCSPERFEPVITQALSNAFFQNSEVIADSTTANTAMNVISLLGFGLNAKASMGFADIEDGIDANGFHGGTQLLPDGLSFTSQLGTRIVLIKWIWDSAKIFIDSVAETIAKSGTVIPIYSGVTAGLASLVTGALSEIDEALSPVFFSGIGMAYFLPMLPTLIWAMAFLSWLLMYAEAIFNAPLAVTLMATPEGEGIAGSRMERKIAMMAALILKPTLLVIGMLMSMAILMIGFVFLNQMFWMGGALTFGDSLLAIRAMIIIWFLIITVFMHNTFKITMTFADDSLEWFLGGIARSFGNNFDGNVMDNFKGNNEAIAGNPSNVTGKSVGIFGNEAGAKTGAMIGNIKGKNAEPSGE
ncbi:DotA/TraY family protein [Vreelandella neptunia]|uniref:DotA/TraY family protein n=1 Tax=Vreelandella neptunia TaxID=115551 RepID=A0ABS9SAM8_9GAMM|nr:DotA/TraY family protein [Halomonas neptunia]MCH4813149.1 DotA/TraY family protein [Halomonas neptunia]